VLSLKISEWTKKSANWVLIVARAGGLSSVRGFREWNFGCIVLASGKAKFAAMDYLCQSAKTRGRGTRTDLRSKDCDASIAATEQEYFEVALQLNTLVDATDACSFHSLHGMGPRRKPRVSSSRSNGHRSR